ncbi:hypothetical protein KBC55_02180 [Patescibacteria group bacterium]|nr:hypothetical protein [Patescibacteria group bacterium]
MLPVPEESREKVYCLEDPRWFAPINVISHYSSHLDSLPREQKKTKAFRKAYELFLGAIMLLGIQEVENDVYWIQPVSDEEQSPDVRTGRQVPVNNGHAPDFERQDIEVVAFIPKPGENLSEFLQRTKLSGNKSYDSKTTILCHIQTGSPVPKITITDELRKTKAVCPVLVLGRTHPTDHQYLLLQVSPNYKIIAQYDAKALLLKQAHQGSLNLRRGSKPDNEHRPNDKHYPFESMGFTCSLI